MVLLSHTGDWSIPAPLVAKQPDVALVAGGSLWTTLAVNLIGCGVIGVLARGLASGRLHDGSERCRTS